ncbi:hypothetical protein VB712_01060 [Spirulina sp. CCNP1310]|uniref:hypothetical protein n=1 Tax=Spirulina sp. CCNP1310 TaxID=3110249 RepID=UPI002B2031F9|nr:hypothetical protein [Spirulina sp. CCNP1310]MEA5417792.1 hypothetical protein [Spirulina sp. CCNP1310]
MMLLKIKPSITFGLAIAAIVFFTAGDQFLPEPMKSWSYNLRTSTTGFISGIFDPSGKLDPNKTHREQLEQI